MSEMEILDIDSYEPDYENACENCGQVPVVTAVKDGKVVNRWGMCGVCVWGESVCLDPAEW